jgi:protein-L-isoaspartate(D-aspartate) O-methyltransferase
MIKRLVIFLFVLCIEFTHAKGGAMITKPDPYTHQREWMLKSQIEARGVTNVSVLQAMLSIPRHLFVPIPYENRAYEDRPLPIGYDQTISQPYMVGFMTQAIDPKATDRILEIGTGCGYQAAVLAQICKEVYTIEIIEQLGLHAKLNLAQLGYRNIHVGVGDGYQGWPEAAPFDAIIITAACPKIPEPLIQQLKIGGTIIVPVGDSPENQVLIRAIKTEEGLVEEPLFPVQFVPLTGHGGSAQ